jgi:hypothetical protein
MGRKKITMRRTAQNRDTRIIHKYPEAKKLKDRIYYCRTRQEVVSLFDSMIVNFGESLTLESLVDGDWIEQEVKTKNKNKPKIAYQGEHVLVPNPKN